MEKVKVTSDVLYQYFTDHGLTFSRLAEMMELSNASLTSCFKHQLINNGVPRNFTAQNIVRLNAALEQLAKELRGCLLQFGSDSAYTNQRGKRYDPALVDPIKIKIGRYFNINALSTNVLGWSKTKKHNVLETMTGKAFGCISQDDANRINTELLSVAGVLSSYEVVNNND